MEEQIVHEVALRARVSAAGWMVFIRADNGAHLQGKLAPKLVAPPSVRRLGASPCADTSEAS